MLKNYSNRLKILLSIIFISFTCITSAQSTLFSFDLTADDYVEEDNSNGNQYLTSSDIELCYDNQYNNGQQTIGIHFTNAKVPQGATVSNCYIQFKADEAQSGTSFTITIKAEDIDNAPTFNSTAYNTSGRTTTTASVTWNPAAWNIDDSGAAQKTPNLSTIIQELVDRASWASDSLVIIITADAGSVDDHRTAYINPILHIEYTAVTENVLYYVSDGDNNLYKVDVSNGNSRLIGATGVSNIEAIANWPSQSGYTLYATDAGNFGTLNFSTGTFTSMGQVDNGGTADGADGTQTLDDIDGLAFDARTGILWASTRRSDDYDLLFQIDPSTGRFIPDVFGSNVDYLEIDGSGVNQDIDDISISSINGNLNVVNNDGGSNDQILKINKSTGGVEVTTVFSSLVDVEGCDFASDGTFYVTEGNGNSLHTADPATGNSTVVKDTLLGGGDVEAIASLVSQANIMSGNVWEDTDVDGIKDAGENTGIENVEIELYFDNDGDGIIDSEDEYLNSVFTDANGDWSFEFATIGHLIAYLKESSLPNDYALTTADKTTANFTSSGQTDASNNYGANSGADCDNDGIPDFVEGTTDSDGDGVQNQCDKDSDNDGILDSEESTADTDGDGIPNYLDLDSDNDGIPDAKEANGGSAPASYSNSGRIGGAVDADGLPTAVYSAGVSSSSNKDSDGDGAKDFLDLDSDNDGILDIIEAGGADSDGDGKIDSFVDSNNDGYHDDLTTSPLPIPNSDSGSEAVNLPNYIDIDSDGDSIDDSREGYSPAGYKTVTIVKDSDGDGILDLYDISSGGASIVPHDFDIDGTPDYLDLDSDDDTGWDIVEGNDANGDTIADTSPSGIDANKNGMDDTFDLYCTGSSTNGFTATSRSEEDNTNGNTDVTVSSDLELVKETNLQTVGIRYTHVTINQGTTVSSAYIQFEADETSSGALTITIQADDVDNSADFVEANGNYDVSGRTKTTASVNWSPADWTNGDHGAAQKTVDIKTVIQEIVNRAAWASGNALTIIITGSDNNKRVATNNPELQITTSDGLMYDCGSDIILNDLNSNSKQDWRDQDMVLPVSIISFSAERLSDKVKLSWTTASEKNNDYFEVQRSFDNIIFEYVDRVDGSGNSNTIVEYLSFDYNLAKGVVYYKLKQVDFDGTTDYSNTIAIRNSALDVVKIFPNPTSGIVNIATKQAVELTIYSTLGTEIINKHFDANTNSKIDISMLSKGIYFITYKTDKEVISEKLIIR